MEEITVSNSSIFESGDTMEFYGSDGMPRKLSVVGHVPNATTVTVTAGPSLWQRIWYYVRHPSWWALALDIPFRPPDI